MTPEPTARVDVPAGVFPQTPVALPSVPPIKPSAAMQAAQAWLDAQYLNRPPKRCAPWDENVWCLAPISRSYALPPVGDIVVAAPEPQRVGLIFSHAGGAAGDIYLNVGAVANAAAFVGIKITSGSLPWQILQADLLTAVTSEWHASATAAGIRIQVLEIVLRDWPRR